MKLIFQIVVRQDNLETFKPSYFANGDRAYLQDAIGYSKIWLLDEFGNLIKEFDDILLDMVINLTSNCKSLNMGGVTQGALFVMEPEWEKHLWFVLENENYRISFNNHRDILMSKSEFHQIVREFSQYSLSTIEYFYQGILENPYYLEWKAEILADMAYLDA